MMKKHNKVKNKGKRLVSFTSLKGFGNQKSAVEYRRLTYTGTLTTTAAGFYSVIFNSTFLRGFAPEWASYAARFTEYRLLRTRVHVSCPNQILTAASYSGNQFVMATDRSGALANPTTIAQTYSLAGSKAFQIPNTQNVPLKYEDSAIDLEDQSYSPVTTNSNDFAIVLCYASTSISTVFASVYVEFMVEFKGAQ
jgi:hypothetical protein